MLVNAGVQIPAEISNINREFTYLLILLGKEAVRADRYRMKRGLGVALFILSFVFYGLLLLLPLTDFSAESKIVISAALVILGEASFWLSVLILGREAMAKYRKIDWRARLSRLLKKV